MYRFTYTKLLRKADDEGWFQPRQNKLLEVCLQGDTNEPLVIEKPIDDGEIQSLISQEPLESALGGLRLIVCAPLQTANDAGRSFPFRRSTFEAIMRSFHLPNSYLQSVYDGSAFFARFSRSSSHRETNISQYVLKTMWASGMNFSLSTSYNPSTGVTSGLLYGCLESELEIVIDRIIAAGVHACHPLMVPTILYELVTERNVQRTKASEGAMNDIELETGEHIYASRKQPDLQSIDNGGSMTARVNGTETTSMFTFANIKSTVIGLNALLENIDNSPPMIGATPRQVKMYEDGLALKECIQYRLSICSNLQLEAEQIRSRAKTQISAIYSLIAQRDSVLNLQVANGSNALADAARRDSSAMKTIAVLTILFLPGTFVAAFFSMPLFDWGASDSNNIILPRFYMYWLVTIPCTLLVVVIWMVWIRINNRIITTEQLKPKAQERSPQKENKGSHSELNASFARLKMILVTRARRKPTTRDEEANVIEFDQGESVHAATPRKRSFLFQSFSRSKES